MSILKGYVVNNNGFLVYLENFDEAVKYSELKKLPKGSMHPLYLPAEYEYA